MTNRAERAAETIVAGIINGVNDLGLVLKPEGEPAFIAAIIEAIENEYPPSSALVSEIAEKIATLMVGYNHRVQWPRAIEIVAAELVDFRRAIELEQRRSPQPSTVRVAALIALRLETLPDSPTLDAVVAAIAEELTACGRGAVAVTEPEVARLIEEAKRVLAAATDGPWTPAGGAYVGIWHDLIGICRVGVGTDNPPSDAECEANVELILFARRRLLDLVTALEQQIAARGEAERALCDIYGICHRIGLDMVCKETDIMQIRQIVNSTNALAQLDNPTESGEPIHDWAWALGQMKAGKPVMRAAVRGNVRFDKHGLLAFSSLYWPHSEDFEATDWQLAQSDRAEVNE